MESPDAFVGGEDRWDIGRLSAAHRRAPAGAGPRHFYLPHEGRGARTNVVGRARADLRIAQGRSGCEVDDTALPWGNPTETNARRIEDTPGFIGLVRATATER